MTRVLARLHLGPLGRNEGVSERKTKPSLSVSACRFKRMSYLYSWCDYSIPLLFNSHYQRDTSVGDPSWIPWPPVFLWGLTLPPQQLHSPLDFPASIRSCHSAAGGMLLVVPSSLKRTYWIAFFSFSQKPAFGRSVDIIWILGLVCCLVKQP